MKKVVVFAMIALMAFSVYAQGTSEASAKKELTTLNVAYMPNYPSLCAVLSAMELGAFEEQGIKVNLIEFADGPTIIAAMESGSIDIGYIGHGAHKLCVNGRASIFLPCHIGNSDIVIGLKSHGINTMEDLKGKKVGYSSGTSSENILLLTLKRAGLTMDDIKAYEMDASALTAAMSSGTLDACATWSPSSYTILANLGDDASTISKNETFSDETVNIGSWIVMPKWAEENHDLLVRFVKAMYVGYDYRADEANFTQVAEWVAKQTGSSYETAYASRGDAKWFTSEFILNGIEDGTIQSYYEVQKKAFEGQVDVSTPLENYILFDVMREAAE